MTFNGATITAKEVSIEDLLSGDYRFAIPNYQRPYSWEKKQVLELLEDLDDQLGIVGEESYYLGAIVLVECDDHFDILDGQQRLTTLTLLLAALRDLAEGEEREQIQQLIAGPGADGQFSARLKVREVDRKLFDEYIQVPGRVADLVGKAKGASCLAETDAARKIYDFARLFYSRLAEGFNAEQRSDLFERISKETFVVVVQTPNLASAFRMFATMNSRGLPLSPADIIKARVIGSTREDNRYAVVQQWERAEKDLGAKGLEELLGVIRAIYVEQRKERSLLEDFDTEIFPRVRAQVLGEAEGQVREVSATFDPGKQFMDGVFVPYADAYQFVVKHDIDLSEWREVRVVLHKLATHKDSDWRPCAVWAARHHRYDVEFLLEFLTRLERLSASLRIRGKNRTTRRSRYFALMQELKAGQGLDATQLRLKPWEEKETIERLDGDIYLDGAPRRFFVLRRLDWLLSEADGVSYAERQRKDQMTVEHVLPQNPDSAGPWCQAFTADERAVWTHRLANLVLLSRSGNSKARNLSFDEKKRKLFSVSGKVPGYALTASVAATPEWTPEVLEQRQRDLLARLCKEWDLRADRSQ